ncbi:phospholipase D-like domain-containing protein [Sphingomonas jaspsi]|uniref:phospholipase D-like domain-containing protein n=1 Tax=Sphingomonas jaspsi TaxID=392409 RepID=UPI0004B28D11|nr:phosphatidylserine/phosphatidylglycerophosphate/cardiolipin synthase family protein [Sphingomonas jaspsi]
MSDMEHPQGPTTNRSIGATVGDNTMLLIPSGQERLNQILSLIDSAQSELALLFYMFSDDVAGNAILEGLTRAAARGVKVRLLIDGFGCGSADAEFLAPLKDAGGHFCIFHPSYGRRYLIRNHQKMAIADRRLALVGGANLDANYLTDQGADRWRDLWLLLDGPAVEELSDYFDDVHAWTTGSRNRIRDLRRIIQRHSHGQGRVSWRFSGPMRRRNPWPGTIAREIDAGKRLDIVAAYFAPSWPMLKRIGRLGLRGTARIVNAAKSDNSATIAAARHTYRRLLRRNVEIYEYQPAKLHTKLYIVDDVVHIGSSNFDFRSLYLNLEIMLRVEDAGFADQMRAYVDAEIADSVRITPDLHRQRASLWRRLKWTLSYWLVTTVDYTVTRRINFGIE